MNPMKPLNCHAIRRSLLLLLLLTGFTTSTLLTPAAHGQSSEDLNVISDWLQYSDVKNTLYRHLSNEALKLLEERRNLVSELNTRQQWKLYRSSVRETLMEIVGPFPEKTPLQPRVTGTLQRPEFTVEKIIYESQPQFYVTAALFLPKERSEPAPAIIYTSGHTPLAFRSEAYQQNIINLVRKGFVVLAVDPVGQGERMQYLDETGEPQLGPTSEHSYAGAQALLAGSSLARYMIWDGIRSVDYLMTRPEVDPERIGITGRSGGGTQAAYIAAFDDRITASAPENYITSFSWLLRSIGPQDAEQNFSRSIASGIDHPELLLAHAPDPALMITTTRDFFSIQGSRETFDEVSGYYRSTENPDAFTMVEDDHGHGSTVANREAMYRFFQEALDLPGPADDLEVSLFTVEELQVTETGQVVTSLGGETLFSLNQKESQRLTEDLERQRGEMGRYLREVDRQARQLSGYRDPVPESPFFTGRYQREGYSVEKYFIKGEGDYPLPYLLFRPDPSKEQDFQEQSELILWIHPEGKQAGAEPGGEIEQLVHQGYTVAAPDLPGTGELGPGLPRGDSYINNVSYNVLFAANQIGRSITGLRAGDINRLAMTLIAEGQSGAAGERVTGTDTGEHPSGLAMAEGGPAGAVSGNARRPDRGIVLIAHSTLTPDALHAAAFSDHFSHLVLTDPLSSWSHLVNTEWYDARWAHSLVPGALTAYDLQDLVALAAPEQLLVISVAEDQGAASGDLEETGRFEEAWRSARLWGEQQNPSSQFEFKQARGLEELRSMLLRWTGAQ